MTEFVPSCYAAFHCIADRCRHSCCKGWEVMIDDATLALYRNLEGELGAKLRGSITEDASGASFRLDAEECCPFLMKSGLCELICHSGEELLCEICALHPRYINELPTRDEWGLGLSCEEACRVILSVEDPLTLVPVTPDTLADPEDTDPDEEAFMAQRAAVLSAAQDRSCKIEDRLRRLEQQYALPEGLTPARAAALLLPLEHLEADWETDLRALSVFEAPDAVDLTAFETAFEQLLSALVLRHFQRVFEGEDYRAVLAFIVFSVRAIRFLFLMKTGASKTPSFEELCDAVRRYSAEIEYSDENVDRLIEALSRELP